MEQWKGPKLTVFISVGLWWKKCGHTLIKTVLKCFHHLLICKWVEEEMASTQTITWVCWFQAKRMIKPDSQLIADYHFQLEQSKKVTHQPGWRWSRLMASTCCSKLGKWYSVERWDSDEKSLVTPVGELDSLASSVNKTMPCRSELSQMRNSNQNCWGGPPLLHQMWTQC